MMKLSVLAAERAVVQAARKWRKAAPVADKQDAATQVLVRALDALAQAEKGAKQQPSRYADRRKVTIKKLDFYQSSTHEPRWDVTFADGTTARTQVNSEFAYVIEGFVGVPLEAFFDERGRLAWARVLREEVE